MAIAIIKTIKHVAWVVLLGLPMFAYANQYLSVQDFLANNFSTEPAVEKFWLNKTHQAKAQKILGHRVNTMRLRYWVKDNKSAWIIDEIGKEKPITTGIVISEQGGEAKIESVEILAFRESRGWEVRYPFFTEQFFGAMLTDNDSLDRRIDGITGATMSVRSVTKSSEWALYLHSQLNLPNKVLAGG
jgi:hypothetical protein